MRLGKVLAAVLAASVGCAAAHCRAQQVPALAPAPLISGPDAEPPGPAPPAESRPFTLSTGASAWNGDYGGSSATTIVAALLGAAYTHDGLRLSASLPYMSIRSAGSVFTGIEGTPIIASSGAPGPKHTHEGLGDLTLGAEYQFDTTPQLGVDLEPSFRVKLPTAARGSGVSTGKADYDFGLEASRVLGPVVPFLRVDYRVLGDTPEIRLRDGLATSLGASVPLKYGAVVNFSYDYARSASRFVRDSNELVASFSSRLGASALRLTGYVSAGLSSGAAAASGGASLTYGF